MARGIFASARSGVAIEVMPFPPLELPVIPALPSTGHMAARRFLINFAPLSSYRE
jgi:hypothetical protein